jgi:WhiB family redox-sensing transcriptional regulator
MSEQRNDKDYAEMAARLDELSAAPIEVLADWVAARGRCLWETTFGDPPDWLTGDDPDRELATRLCAGCPVRSECLEYELRVGGEETVGVWGGLNITDRLALLKVWRARRREEIAALPDDEGWWRVSGDE